MALELKSKAFKNGDFIPEKYTGNGMDISPPLEWSDVPEGTKSFALICDDPDAPVGTWVHWVIYDIPGDKRGLPEGVKKDKALPDGSKQGMTDFRKIGYWGPSPPPGTAHRYFFKLYALGDMAGLESSLTKNEVMDRINRVIIEEAKLMGRFKR